MGFVRQDDPTGFELTLETWDGAGPGTTRGVEYFAREAAQAMETTVTHVPGDLGMLTTVLAMPHEDRSVTTEIGRAHV